MLLTGCKKELENPELIDPIYNSIVSERKSVEKALKDENSKLATLSKELKSIKPRSIERKVNIRETQKSKQLILKLQQHHKYLEIRQERRRVESRRNYRMALENNLPWPDKNEYKRYQTHQRLRIASMNWNERVPKLHNRNPNFKSEK